MSRSQCALALPAGASFLSKVYNRAASPEAALGSTSVHARGETCSDCRTEAEVAGFYGLRVARKDMHCENELGPSAQLNKSC